MTTATEETSIVTKIRISPESKEGFADWQAYLNSVITTFPGFVSLEIISPQDESQSEWMIVTRFHTAENITAWRASQENKTIMERLKPLVADGDSIREISSGAFGKQGGVTEVIVAQVNPEREEEYKKWTAKIHQVEAKFPGFRGVYVQSPSSVQGHNWITLLQFDTPENLENWLASEERKEVMRESTNIIRTMEEHRVVSPYAGWFASVYKAGEPPPAWKQALIVLAVLYPVVMLELKYLTPLTATLSPAVGMFIGNVISVGLLTWPLVPIAIYFLSWWLTPNSQKRLSIHILGTLILILLYLLEIYLLSKLF